MIDVKDARKALDMHILQTLAEGESPFGITDTYYYLAAFEGEHVTRALARALLRDLTDRGLCQYRSGLFTEEGETAGSGYGITHKGLAYYNRATEFGKVLEDAFTYGTGVMMDGKRIEPAEIQQ